MGLTCYCGDDYDWYYTGPEDFSTLATKRARRCCSCKAKIPVGGECARFERFRCAENDIEERIWGDSVQLADRFMCEACAGLYFSLEELGFCINLGDNMRELVRDYADTYGPKQPHEWN